MNKMVYGSIITPSQNVPFEILCETFAFLKRNEIEKCQLVSLPWNSSIKNCTNILPLRKISNMKIEPLSMGVCRMQRYHDDGCDCGIMLRLHLTKWDYEKWDEEIHFKRRRTERDTGKNICYNIYDIDKPDFKIRNAQSLFFELIEIDGNHSEYPQSLLEKLMEFLKKLFGAAKKINAQRFRIINNAHFELVKLLGNTLELPWV